MKITKLLVMLFSITIAACGGGGGGSGGGSTTAAINATATTTAQSLTVGTAMTSFSPLTPSGGATPYTYSYTGTLPTGLSFNTSTGAVTGTPTVTYATASLVFSVKDANNVTASMTSTVSFTVVAGWTATGGLITARTNHTATVLPNGKVLVSGGWDGTAYIASTELYDPATGIWTQTGGLITARANHTATLLANGKVLVAGGTDQIRALNSAELYDPSTGIWFTTGSLHNTEYSQIGRCSHTAILLANGKVLVSGGYYWSNANAMYLASAELYDPATGNWNSTGSQVMEHSSHTATLLTNGQVLVSGGRRRYLNNANEMYLASAELYDPATGSWTLTGSLVIGRNSHTATMLTNGKVLVAGGEAISGKLASAELY